MNLIQQRNPDPRTARGDYAVRADVRRVGPQVGHERLGESFHGELRSAVCGVRPVHADVCHSVRKHSRQESRRQESRRTGEKVSGE